MFYVASSWRNEMQPYVVIALRHAGLAVYDFKNPPDSTAFSWSQIDPAWHAWNPQRFIAGLQHPLAQAGFASDMGALNECTAGILVLPSGRSAHLEAGHVIGKGKPLAIYLGSRLVRPELMYLMADHMTDDLASLVNWARKVAEQVRP